MCNSQACVILRKEEPKGFSSILMTQYLPEEGHNYSSAFGGKMFSLDFTFPFSLQVPAPLARQRGICCGLLAALLIPYPLLPLLTGEFLGRRCGQSPKCFPNLTTSFTFVHVRRPIKSSPLGCLSGTPHL